MDPELLKQKAEFKKRALATPAVQASKRSAPSDEGAAESKPSTSKNSRSAGGGTAFGVSTSSTPNFDSRSSGAGASTAPFSTRFGNMARIVDHMKKRHLGHDDWPLTLDEIFRELMIFDVSNKEKQWLDNTALPENRRIRVNVEHGKRKFSYKPPFEKLKGAKSLMRLLKQHDLDLDKKGGILLSELADSMANPEKALEALGDEVKIIPTTISKKKDKVLYYNERSSALPIEEKFRQMWREINIEHVDEAKIEEYLQKHGITSMEDSQPKSKFGAAGQVPKRKPGRRPKVGFQNEHVQGLLQDFSAGKI